MAFPIFLLEAVLVSLSGVMAPGPVTAVVVVGKGSESPHAGGLVAIGHGIVEIPLMVAVFRGVGVLLDVPYVQAGIALAGGAFLLLMGVGMLRGIKGGEVQGRAYGRSSVAAGVLLSIGNPYFLVWWATIGAALILRSVEFGVVGFLAFALAHWLCDLVWSYFLSVLSYKGGQFFGRRFQQGAFCGVRGPAGVFQREAAPRWNSGAFRIAGSRWPSSWRWYTPGSPLAMRGPLSLLQVLAFSILMCSCNQTTGTMSGCIAFVDRYDNIGIVRPDGSDRKMLTTTGPAVSPQWSPDGKLAFVSRRDGDPEICHEC